MAITRREFVIGAGGVSVSLLFSGATKAALFPQRSGRRVLVVLQLSGGNDALNTFIPYTDPRYRAARPGLALSDQEILKVSDRIGFHPSMGPLQELYEKRKFAFVNNVGFQTLDRSHFRCRDVWQTGDESQNPSSRGARGWLGRYADTYLSAGATSLTTFSVGPRSPLALVAGSVMGTSLTDPDAVETATDLLLDPRDEGDHDAYRKALLQIYGQSRAGDVELARSCGNAAFQVIDLFKKIGPPSTVSYPGSYLGKTLRLIARLAAADIGTGIIWVSVDGFDTHGRQAATHSALLAEVSNSLSAFQEDLGARALSESVLLMAWSEFGRRVFENGNQGTDHGKAGTVLLLGDGVEGGTFYGGVPDLANLDDGDLRTQIDFRSVYWTIIQDWLGHDPLPVLQNKFENLGFLRRSGRVRAARH